MDFSWTPVYVHMNVTTLICAKCDLRRSSLNATNFQRVDYTWVAFGNGIYCGGLSRQVVQQAKSAEGGKFPWAARVISKNPLSTRKIQKRNFFMFR
jgi:hypothetical protein